MEVHPKVRDPGMMRVKKRMTRRIDESKITAFFNSHCPCIADGFGLIKKIPLLFASNRRNHHAQG
jgi:hypothetical protein